MAMNKRNAITVEEAQERLRQIKIDVRTEWMKQWIPLGVYVRRMYTP